MLPPTSPFTLAAAREVAEEIARRLTEGQAKPSGAPAFDRWLPSAIGSSVVLVEGDVLVAAGNVAKPGVIDISLIPRPDNFCSAFHTAADKILLNHYARRDQPQRMYLLTYRHLACVPPCAATPGFEDAAVCSFAREPRCDAGLSVSFSPRPSQEEVQLVSQVATELAPLLSSIRAACITPELRALVLAPLGLVRLEAKEAGVRRRHASRRPVHTPASQAAQAAGKASALRDAAGGGDRRPPPSPGQAEQGAPASGGAGLAQGLSAAAAAADSEAPDGSSPAACGGAAAGPATGAEPGASTAAGAGAGAAAVGAGVGAAKACAEERAGAGAHGAPEPACAQAPRKTFVAVESFLRDSAAEMCMVAATAAKATMLA